MTTSYTAPVQDGKITTLAEYALNCARAFAIDMRDEPNGPLKDPAPPNTDYYDEQVTEAMAELVRLESDEYAANVMQREKMELEAADAKYAAHKAQTRERYEAMLALVFEWQPPTPEHQGLRDFMESQLRESIKFDCPDGDWSLPKPPSTLPAWRLERIAKLHKDIQYATEQTKKAHARYAHNLEWARALRQSLPQEESHD